MWKKSRVWIVYKTFFLSMSRDVCVINEQGHRAWRWNTSGCHPSPPRCTGHYLLQQTGWRRHLIKESIISVALAVACGEGERERGGMISSSPCLTSLSPRSNQQLQSLPVLNFNRMSRLSSRTYTKQVNETPILFGWSSRKRLSMQRQLC